MACELYNREHVIDKLHQTICLYEGEPVFVRITNGLTEREVEITNLITSKKTVVDYTNDSFDYSAFPLGYLNHPGTMEAFFITRVPYRGRHQGLHVNNISPYVDMNVFTSHPMYNCITGTHPPFRDVLQIMNKEYFRKSMAFHRYGALVRVFGTNYNLEYRGSPIASVNKEGSVTPFSSFKTSATRNIMKSMGI